MTTEVGKAILSKVSPSKIAIGSYFFLAAACLTASCVEHSNTSAMWDNFDQRIDTLAASEGSLEGEHMKTKCARIQPVFSKCLNPKTAATIVTHDEIDQNAREFGRWLFAAGIFGIAGGGSLLKRRGFFDEPKVG